VHSKDTVPEWLIPDSSAQTVNNLKNKWRSLNKNALDILTINADACFDASALCMCQYQNPSLSFHPL